MKTLLIILGIDQIMVLVVIMANYNVLKKEVLNTERVCFYWLCKKDRWSILPTVEISVGEELFDTYLTIEISLLNRWSAIEIKLTNNP